MQELVYEERDRTAFLTLNRPQVRNCLSMKLSDELIGSIERVRACIWQQHTCIIVHPGITGDRGPSSFDWAILNASKEWGVTLLQAGTEMDAGDIWASRPFSMRA